MKPCCNTYNFWSSVSAISNQAQSLRLVARLILTRNSTCWVLTCCLASSSPSSFTIWWTLSPSDLILSTKCNACCSSLVKKWNERVLKNTDKTRKILVTICLLQEAWYEHQDNSNSSRGHFIPRSRHFGNWPRKIPQWWQNSTNIFAVFLIRCCTVLILARKTHSLRYDKHGFSSKNSNGVSSRTLTHCVHLCVRNAFSGIDIWLKENHDAGKSLNYWLTDA